MENQNKPSPVKFPRNPDRDEKGNAVLYPGLPKFEGVAGLFNTSEGELVILAPTFEALQAHVDGILGMEELSRSACIISTWERLPEITAQDIAETMHPRVGWDL